VPYLPVGVPVLLAALVALIGIVWRTPGAGMIWAVVWAGPPAICSLAGCPCAGRAHNARVRRVAGLLPSPCWPR
jgi:hypothetical protein